MPTLLFKLLSNESYDQKLCIIYSSLAFAFFGEVSHAAHGFHHFFHLGVAAHFLHHVHDIGGSSQLRHHLRVNHLLEFTQYLVLVPHQIGWLFVLANVCLFHLLD